MGQTLIRQLDDEALVRLRARARAQNMSVEALARDAIHRVAAELTVEEKLERARQMLAMTSLMVVPGVRQTPAVELIREDRYR